MSRQNKKLAMTDEPKGEHDDFKPEPGSQEEIDEDEEAMDQTFADFPQNDPCLELFRVKEKGGRPQFIEQMSPNGFTHAYVCENFGGGKYFLRGKYRDGSRRKMNFEIEGDPFPLKRKMPDPSAHPQQVILNQPDREDDRQEYPREGMGIFEIMQLIGRAEEKAEKRQQALFEMMFRNQNTQVAVQPVDQIFSVVEKVMTIANSAGGGDAPWWMMAVRELKEPLTKAIDTFNIALSRQGAPGGGGVMPPTQPSTLPPQAPPPPPGLLPGAVSPSPGESNGLPDPMVTQIKATLPFLINGARKNTDPSMYVDIILDQIPEAEYPRLRDFLLSPGCLDKLTAYEPGIAYQQEWWEGLRQAILEVLQEEIGDLPFLINGARKNTDPSMYVDIILDQIPEAEYPRLRDFLLSPGCLDKLTAYEPGIAYQQEWWEGLRQAILEVLQEEIGDGVRTLQPNQDQNPSATPPTDGGAIPESSL